MGAVYLGGIETGLLGAPDGVGEGDHELLDLLLGEGVRHEGLVGVLHRGGRQNRIGVDPVATGARVVHLGEALGALVVDDLSSAPQPGDHELVVVGNALARHRREALTVPVRDLAAWTGTHRVLVHSAARVDPQQAGTAASSLLQVTEVAGLTKAGTVGGGDNAVAHGEVADLQLLEQPTEPATRWVRPECSFPAPQSPMRPDGHRPTIAG